MKPIRVTHLVFDEIFFTTDFTCSLKLSLSETNKKPDPGSSSIPQRYFWGIRVIQNYLYVISDLRLCSIGNDVTDCAGLSEPF
jgi:hypothetical protein